MQARALLLLLGLLLSMCPPGAAQALELCCKKFCSNLPDGHSCIANGGTFADVAAQASLPDVEKTINSTRVACTAGGNTTINVSCSCAWKYLGVDSNTECSWGSLACFAKYDDWYTNGECSEADELTEMLAPHLLIFSGAVMAVGVGIPLCCVGGCLLCLRNMRASERHSMKVRDIDYNAYEDLLKVLSDAWTQAGSPTVSVPDDGRFSEVRTLIVGHPIDAVHGLEHFMAVDRGEVLRGMVGGIPAMVDEVAAKGTPEDIECLDYVLYKGAGTSDVVFSNGNLKRDCDASGNTLPERLVAGRAMKLVDFFNHPAARKGSLTLPQVAALRFYSTAGFKTLNNALRKNLGAEKSPHPLPVTMALIRDGVKALRAADAMVDDDASKQAVDLWRGLKDMALPPPFFSVGGTEVSPMSTTADPSIAIKYSMSSTPMLFRLRTKSFVGRGAEITFLSAFPAEREILFPPLTYLRPLAVAGKTEPHVVRIGGTIFRVVDVEPMIP